MNKQSRRKEIIEDFREKAGGSFSTIYKALSDTARANKGSTHLKREDVSNRIKKIRKELSGAS